MSRNTGAWPEGTPAWVDLMVTDLSQAQDFYGGLFAWDFNEASRGTGGYAIASVDGDAVAGVGELSAEAAAPSASWTTYLAVNNADVTAAKIRAAGGRLSVDPVDVPGGRMAIAHDPGGAYFGLWQSGSRTGATVVREPSTVCWNEVLTRDFPATTTFYTTVFGYTTSDMTDEDFVYCSLELEGTPVSGIGKLPAGVPAEIPAHWMTYFACADTDATVDRAIGLGALVLNEPVDAGFGRLAVLEGPEGEVFSVVTMHGQ